LRRAEVERFHRYPVPSFDDPAGISGAGGIFSLCLVLGVVPFATDDAVPQAEIDRLLAGRNLPDYYAEPMPPISAEALEAQKVAFTWCRFCHTLEEGGENRVGPNLYRIVGKPAAVAPHFVYSQAFVRCAREGTGVDAGKSGSVHCRYFGVCPA
jgi:hypothetical protein